MHRRAGLDACVLINLVASGIELEELAAATRSIFCITKVVARETFSLYPGEAGAQRTLVNVEGLIRARHLEMAVLDDEEVDVFVSLAAELDDGEASVIAVAAARGWPVLTDDRRASRVAAGRGLELIGTPALMRTWESAGSAAAARVGLALHRIETRARYMPRRDDPDRGWWNQRVAPFR